MVSNFAKTFAGKKVLVTGDTGFKGSWLSFMLHESGAQVLGLALPPKTERDHFVMLKMNTLFTHIDGDIRDAALVDKVFAEFQPEFVFHLAAQPLVRRSYSDPRETWDTNVSGSVNVLEAIRKTPTVRSVIYVTSDKCYRNKEWVWGYRETDELGGHDPYSASKAAAEIVYSSYVDSFFRQRENFGIATVRSGNVIGGGDFSEDRIFPDCIRALESGKPITLRNPSSTRPWQHVLDPIYAYMLLAEKIYNEPKTFSGAWNFGPLMSSFRTVKDLAQTVLEHWGTGQIVTSEDPNALHENKFLHLNCDKAHSLLNWQPRWNFAKAIEHTTAWYKNASASEKALEMTRKQIAFFMEMNG